MSNDVVNQEMSEREALFFSTALCWINHWQATHNPRHKSFLSYRRRGITWWPEWDSFDSFVRSVGIKRLGTEFRRLDPSKGYGPDNCSWLPARISQTDNQPTNQEI